MILIEEKINLLEQTNFFGNISRENKEAICQRMGMKNVDKNEFLFKEGDIGKEFFLIAQGEVEIVRQDTMIAVLKKGDIFGEIAVISQGFRSASAKAKGDVIVFFLKREALESIIYEFPSVALKLLKVTVNRFQKSNNDVTAEEFSKIELSTEEFSTIEKSSELSNTRYKKCPNCYELNGIDIKKCLYCEHSFHQSFWHFLLVSILCVIIMGLSIGSYWYLIKTKKASPKDNQEKIPTVLVAPLESKSVRLEVEGYGRVKSYKFERIQSRISGKIIEFHKNFHVGKFVQKGDVLIQLDSDQYKRNVETAKNTLKAQEFELSRLRKMQKNVAAEIKIATTNQELASEAFKRAQALKQQGALSELDLYRAQQNYITTRLELLKLENSRETYPNLFDIAKVAFLNAKLELENARKQLEWTIIKAPFSGRIKSIEIDGNTSVTSSTLIATLEDISSVEIPIVVSLGQISKLFDKDVSINSLQQEQWNIPTKVSAFMGDKEFLWEGRVIRFEPIMEKNQTVSIVVKVEKPWQSTENPPLQVNTFVKVVFLGRTVENVCTISRDWLREDNTIHIIDNDKLKIIPVHIIHRFKDQLVIEQQANPNNSIIITPLSFPIPEMLLKAKEINHEHN